MIKNSSGWHVADITAAMRKKGMPMAALSGYLGYSKSTLHNAVRKPWPKGEYIIATVIGVHPSEIWPARYYTENGTRIEKNFNYQLSPIIIKKIKDALSLEC